MKVDGAASSLIQGVSQQPARERLPGQCTLQENMSSDPVNGLIRRPPTDHVAGLFTSASSYRFFEYNGESLGHFIIAYKSGDIRVFGLDGAEKTVTVQPGSAAYLTDAEMRAVGIDNKIYITNPGVTAAMLGTTKTYIKTGSIAFLLGGEYGRKYELKVNWRDAGNVAQTATVSYTTPDGSASSHILDIATDAIATQLTALFVANGTLNGIFDITRVSDVLYIRKKTASTIIAYSVEVSDGAGGVNFLAVNNSVTDTGKLPRYAPQGYVVNVTESGTSSVDDWWLEFVVPDDDAGNAVATGAGFGLTGKWVEAVAPDIPYLLDTTTMPHVLTKTGATTFSFGPATWEGRLVGDETTNANPSFVGNTIVDMQAFQGRLVLLSDVNCVMSRSNKHTAFFNQSATTLADSDPIDISSSLGTYLLRRVIPHNRDLIIMSDRAQFIVFGRNMLTPKNSSLVLTTEFETDLSATPVGSGKNIFMCSKYGEFVSVQEYFAESSTDTNNARSITQHVLQYVQGTPVQLVSTTNFSKLLVRTDKDLRSLYMYEYIWAGDTKAQSAWSTLVFPDPVVFAFFDNSLMYMVCKGTDNVYRLRTLNLNIVPDTGVGYRVMLDMKVRAPGVGSTFTVPYPVDDISNFVAVQATGCPNPGMLAPIQSFAAGVVTLRGNMGGGTVVFGKKFSSRYIPTPFMVKDQDKVKIGRGKLTIKHVFVFFSDTGHAEVTVRDEFGYSQTVVYTGRIVGDPNNRLGEAVVTDGSFAVPVKKNADRAELEVFSDSHLPLSLLELEWVGQWRKSGKRIQGNGG